MLPTHKPFSVWPGCDDANAIDVPYEFTGNANEEWAQLFMHAYQFAVWANRNCVGYYEEDKPQITFEVSHHGDGTADGITIMLHGGWSVGNSLVEQWHQFMGQLTTVMWPDGELHYTNQPGDDGVIFHLWHD